MLSGHVAVKVDKAEEITASGIIIPETVVAGRENNSYNYGVVAVVAPDITDVAVGDRVCFIEGTYWRNEKRTNPNEFEHEGVKLTRVPFAEIKFVIE